MPRRPALVVAPLTLLVLLTATLAGCAEPTRLPPPEPSAAAPLFASDEEALAAATAAYEEYLAVVDAAFKDPTSSDRDALGEVAVGEALIELGDSLQTFADRGLRFEGGRSLVDVLLQQGYPDGDAYNVRMYVCESVQGLDVVDAAGNSVVEPTRPQFTAFEVLLVLRADAEVVSERALWVDQQFCSV